MNPKYLGIILIFPWSSYPNISKIDNMNIVWSTKKLYFHITYFEKYKQVSNLVSKLLQISFKIIVN